MEIQDIGIMGLLPKKDQINAITVSDRLEVQSLWCVTWFDRTVVKLL